MGSTTLQLATQVTSWPIDWIILIGLVALAALESFKSGSSRTRAISIALPLTLVVTNWLPNTIGIEKLAPYLTTPVAINIEFLVVAVGLFILMYRLFFAYGFANGSVLNALLTGLSTAIIVVVVWLQVPSLDSVWHFSEQIRLLFSEAYRLWWLLLAFLLMAVAAS